MEIYFSFYAVICFAQSQAWGDFGLKKWGQTHYVQCALLKDTPVDTRIIPSASLGGFWTEKMGTDR